MDTLEYLSQYLSSPIVSHRNRAINIFVENALLNSAAVDQLGKNLGSENLDIVIGSLKIIFAVSLRNKSTTSRLSKKIMSLGKKSEHFEVVLLCKEILANLNNTSTAENLKKKLTPCFKNKVSTKPFHVDCDLFIEYALGNQKYKYVLENICDIFEIDCKKAFKKVKRLMKELGYKDNKQYRKERPHRWRYDFDGVQFETSLNYYARHALNLFLMWCIQNLNTSEEGWDEFVSSKQIWDLAIPESLISKKPYWLVFKDLNTDVNTWLKMRIKKEEAYELLNLENKWVPLYEYTHFKGEGKSLNRYMSTCFIMKPTGKISKKMEFKPPRYSCDDCHINNLPISAYENGQIWLHEDSHYDFLKDKLLPTFGTASENYADYCKVFPAPEIVNYFKLKQKKNTLEYYKGKELVIHCINWRGGYRRSVDNRGEDEFELANYGYILMIKSKYLKKYMRENKLKLIAVGSISKYKIKMWSHDYDSKNSKYKWLPMKILSV